MLEPFSAEQIGEAFAQLESRAREELAVREDVSSFEFRRYARLRFAWQLHELEMRLPDGEITDEVVEQISREFVAMYAERYGEAALLPGARLQIDSLRLEPAITMGSAGLDRLDVSDRPFHKGSRDVYFERGAGAEDTPVYNGDAMPVGEVVEGPAVIDLAITGIVLPPGTRCERRQTGDFVLTLEAA
jgi:N-methylhydantoinase A